MNHTRFILVISFLTSFYILAAPARAAEFVVSQNGTMQARIVIPADANQAVKNAAKLLADYLGKITGSTPAVKAESAATSKPATAEIHLGGTKYVKSLPLNVDALDMDGYVISCPSPDRLIIVGGKYDPNGLEFGVCNFLHRFCGVRWLFPGDLGTEIPKRPSLKINVDTIRDEPVYLSRRWGTPENWGNFERASQRTKPMAVWARRNRERGRIAYHHNVYRIFDPKRIGKTHPEVFPIRNGKRFIPTPDHHKHAYWQPCFTAPTAVGIATDYILGELKTQPIKTFSLGVNDIRGFCECERCLAMDGETKNYLGCRNRSRSYFTWANAVAKNVLKVYPDAKLGFLAYSCIGEPPADIPLNPCLVPYITSERLKWLNPEFRDRDIAVHNQWHKAVPEIGWYDYIWGGFYPLPRIYFHAMADYLRWGAENGAKHYYAQADVDKDWPEGPKFSLTLALLWNPNLDVDAFLQDWYVSAVGPQAAPLLKAYFDFWEEFWTKRVPRTEWFREGAKNQFFDFMKYDYLQLLSDEDIASLRKLLADLPAKAPAGKKRRRAEHIKTSYNRMLDHLLVRIAFEKANANLKPTPSKRILYQDNFDTFSRQNPANSDGWDLWTRKYGNISGVLLPERNGARGVVKLDLSQANNSPAAMQKSFPLQPGKVYVATFRVKGENLTAPVGVNVRFHQPTPIRCQALRDIPNLKSKREKLSNDQWRNIRFAFAVPANMPKVYCSSVVVTLFVENVENGALLVDSFTLGESELKKSTSKK